MRLLHPSRQLALIAIMALSASPFRADSRAAAQNNNSIPSGAQMLIEAYPQCVKGYENNQIIFADGTKMLYDDGKKKGFEEMLDNSDIEDMFSMTYVCNGKAPAYLADAGRSRNDALFKKMYGRTEAEVRKKLVSVNWFGQKYMFTSVNGAAEQLKKVAEELQKHPELKKYMKCAGTLNWRKVRGANRMSAHSYGIAIDIGSGFSHYWLWSNKNAKELTKNLKYQNSIPMEIVRIFQKHGFIWGGAWYHYDTMHFEYRPEILKTMK